VVDVCSRAEPQLRAVLPARVHDGEVIFADDEYAAFLLVSELSDASDEEGDPVAFGPVARGADLGAHVVLLRVAAARGDHEARALVERSKKTKDLKKQTI
jgi:hypothetical protein